MVLQTLSSASMSVTMSKYVTTVFDFIIIFMYGDTFVLFDSA